MTGTALCRSTWRGWAPALSRRGPASEAASLAEADDTAVAFAVLRQAGYDVDDRAIYGYEEATHFRCYLFERNPSISANAHVLSALRMVVGGQRDAAIAKILAF